MIVSTNYKGYGAIAVGTNASGVRLIGASVGNSTLSGALTGARSEAQLYGGMNVYIYTYWNDSAIIP